MRLKKTRYYYTTSSFEVGETTIEISSSQYKELRHKFDLDIASNKRKWENCENGAEYLFDTQENVTDLSEYKETRFYVSECRQGATTYTLIKQECKDGYKFAD